MRNLNTQIIIGTLLGILAGYGLRFVPADAALKIHTLYVAGLCGSLFMDLLKMILVPLIFTSICVGIANLQAHHQAKRVWLITLSFFAVSMSAAIILGLTASNLVKPGQGLQLSLFADAISHYEHKALAPKDFLADLLHGLFINPFAAFAAGNVLAILVFALFFGAAMVAVGDRAKPLMTLMTIVLELIMRIVGWVMRLAPIGIAGLLTKLVANQNGELLTTLLQFIMLVIVTLIIHGVIVLPGTLWLLTRKTPLWFWRGARPALITAFATSSSNATVPITLRCTEDNLKVDNSIAGFVVPLGATINMDGTALYEAAAALFVANLAGIELSMGQQLIVFCTAMIAAIGAPGIPSAGMVTMVMVLQSVGLPTEAIAILLPIDRLLDTFRTAVNVEGDMVGSVIVQHFVGGTEAPRNE